MPNYTHTTNTRHNNLKNTKKKINKNKIDKTNTMVNITVIEYVAMVAY